MKTRNYFVRLAAVVAILGSSASAQTIWEAFNDHRAGISTSPNATAWDLRGAGAGGPLKDIATGADLPASLLVEEEGGVSDDFGANSAVNLGSPADLLFADKCTIGGVDNMGIPGIRSSTGVVLRLRFTDLDPSKRYQFRGTTCRGNDYVDRWAVFKIVEADGAEAAHTDGSDNQNIFTAITFPAGDLLADEVALNSGDNKAGSLVGWDNIDPGADGTFAIEARQYIGVAPFGAPSAGPYGYGLSAIYLAETSSSGLGFVITDVDLGEDGRVTITSTARSGVDYAVDVSTDLIHWDELTDNATAEDGFLIYTDNLTAPGVEPRLFYRVRQL